MNIYTEQVALESQQDARIKKDRLDSSHALPGLVSRLPRPLVGLNSGFTLIEIMVVIIILGILVGIIAPRLMEEPDKARVVKAQMQIESIATALKKYKLDHGDYPTTEQGLQALVEKPSIGKIPKK